MIYVVMQNYLLAILSIFFLCNCQGPLQLIGYNKKGEVKTYGVSEKAYIKSLSKAVGEVQESVDNAMKKNYIAKNKWELQLIAVGLTLRTEVGFGPFRAGVAPGIRVFFSNVDNPPPLP